MGSVCEGGGQVDPNLTPRISPRWRAKLWLLRGHRQTQPLIVCEKPHEKTDRQTVGQKREHRYCRMYTLGKALE